MLLPREKLFSQGPQVLSNEELIALLLRTGTAGKNVWELAREVLERSGGICGLFENGWEELCQITGLGPAKIAELKAAFELSRRCLSEELHHRRDLLSSPQEVRDYFQYTLRHLKEEIFQVILLDHQHQILQILTLSEGTPYAAVFSAREIIKQAFRFGATGLVLVHNHPHGNAAPSKEDRAATKDLLYAGRLMGLTVYEHLIIAKEETYSFAESGEIRHLNQAFENR